MLIFFSYVLKSFIFQIARLNRDPKQVHELCLVGMSLIPPLIGFCSISFSLSWFILEEFSFLPSFCLDLLIVFLWCRLAGFLWISCKLILQCWGLIWSFWWDSFTGGVFFYQEVRVLWCSLCYVSWLPFLLPRSIKSWQVAKYSIIHSIISWNTTKRNVSSSIVINF